MDGPGNHKNRMRIMGISAAAGFFAPLVFLMTLGMRKVNRRAKFFARGWNKRLQHEISRWT